MQVAYDLTPSLPATVDSGVLDLVLGVIRGLVESRVGGVGKRHEKI